MQVSAFPLEIGGDPCLDSTRVWMGNELAISGSLGAGRSFAHVKQLETMSGTLEVRPGHHAAVQVRDRHLVIPKFPVCIQSRIWSPLDLGIIIRRSQLHQSAVSLSDQAYQLELGRVNPRFFPGTDTTCGSNLINLIGGSAGCELVFYKALLYLTKRREVCDLFQL